jgi:hypothetical protein
VSEALVIWSNAAQKRGMSDVMNRGSAPNSGGPVPSPQLNAVTTTMPTSTRADRLRRFADLVI